MIIRVSHEDPTFADELADAVLADLVAIDATDLQVSRHSAPPDAEAVSDSELQSKGDAVSIGMIVVAAVGVGGAFSNALGEGGALSVLLAKDGLLEKVARVLSLHLRPGVELTYERTDGDSHESVKLKGSAAEIAALLRTEADRSPQ